jgi:hypothetical protein
MEISAAMRSLRSLSLFGESGATDPALARRIASDLFPIRQMIRERIPGPMVRWVQTIKQRSGAGAVRPDRRRSPIVAGGPAPHQSYFQRASLDRRLVFPPRWAPKQPRISVVIPAFNAQRYLAEAVESVLQQSYSNFECLVIDDGSTDRTREILAELALRDGRVKPIRIEHSGIVKALNVGVEAAQGELIARMDADDVCMPERFARQVEYLDQHPECVAVGSAVMLVDPFGSDLWEIQVHAEHDQIDASLLKGDGWALFHPSAVLRRQAILDVGGYRRAYQWAEDMDLFLRLSEIGRLANLPDVLLRYRQHFASVNRTKLDVQRDRSAQVVAEAYQRRRQTMPVGFQLRSASQLTPYDQVQAWCRHALTTGNFYAARRHALAALRVKPLRYDSWRLVYHAMGGH